MATEALNYLSFAITGFCDTLNYSSKTFDKIKFNPENSAKFFGLISESLKLTGNKAYDATVNVFSEFAKVADTLQVFQSCADLATLFNHKSVVKIVEKAAFSVANISDTLSFGKDFDLIYLDNWTPQSVLDLRDKLEISFSTVSKTALVAGLSIVNFKNLQSVLAIANKDFKALASKDGLSKILSLASTITEFGLLVYPYKAPISKDKELKFNMFAKTSYLASVILAKN